MKLYTNVNIIFFIYCLIVVTIFFFGFANFPHSARFTNDFLKSLANWDGGHYVGIAESGYKEKFQYAFFPLYPLTIRVVNQFVQNYTLSAVLVSVISAIFALDAFYKLVSSDFSKKIAKDTIFWLLFFPTSFYFLTAYSEGLFLFLTISAFLFLRKGNLFLATIFAALASATRLVGLAVVIALLLEVQLAWRINKKNWYVLLSFGGFLIYSWFLYKNTGDPFYFITAEKHWLRNLTPPGVGFWETLKSIVTPGFIFQNFNWVLDLLFAIFGLGMIIRSFRFLPTSYGVYGLISIALPLFTPSLSSMPRFLLPIFPIFILLSLIKNKYVIFAYQLIFISLLAIFSVLFINGYWVS